MSPTSLLMVKKAETNTDDQRKMNSYDGRKSKSKRDLLMDFVAEDKTIYLYRFWSLPSFIYL